MRSLLFVPGDNPSMLQNAFVFDSDFIIIDLEDAVTINNKDAARILVEQYLKVCNNLSKVVVRINGFDTPFYQDDLAMLSAFDIYAVMVPKVTTKVMQDYSNNYSFKVIPIIETCIGVVELSEIVKFDNIVAILLGAEDLTSDLGVVRTAQGIEILLPRQQLAYYCKAYDIVAIDTPCTNANDNNVVETDARYAKQLGLKAKACIHPNQVPIVNEVFSVSESEVLWAKRVLKALESNVGKGAFSLDGQMIDEPIIRRAKNFIKKYEENGGDLNE